MEEEEGVEINISVEDWPDELAGVRIADKTFMVDYENKKLKIIADPVWSIEGLTRKVKQDGSQLSFWED